MQIVHELVAVAWRLEITICEVTVAVGADGLSGVVPAGGLDLVCSGTGKECMSFPAVDDSHSHPSVVPLKLYGWRYV